MFVNAYQPWGNCAGIIFLNFDGTVVDILGIISEELEMNNQE